MTIDLTYTKDAFFATFFVNSQDGLSAYHSIIEANGSPKVYLAHLDNLLYQLKQAGYRTRLTHSKKGSDSFTQADEKLLEKLFSQ